MEDILETTRQPNKYDLYVKMTDADNVGLGGLGKRVVRESLNRMVVMARQCDGWTLIESTFLNFNSMNTIYSGCRVIDTAFIESDFNCNRFENSYFHKVRFQKVTLRNTVLEGSFFGECEFNFQDPPTVESQLSFKNCVFKDTVFTSESGGTAKGISFDHCIFLGKAPWGVEVSSNIVLEEEGTHREAMGRRPFPGGPKTFPGGGGLSKGEAIKDPEAKSSPPDALSRFEKLEMGGDL